MLIFCNCKGLGTGYMISGMQAAVIEKFWANVEKTPTCWNWTGRMYRNLPAIRSGGHHGTVIFARRVSLEIVGKLAGPVGCICGNIRCVNPDHLTSGDEARFWAKVQKLSEENGGCWVWVGAQNKLMYGTFAIRANGRRWSKLAHVYSWYLHTGFMPKTLCVCHKCDHPYCVNPAHLFIGTPADNAEDKVIKGRQPRGEQSSASKLSEDQVREVRHLKLEGLTQQKIADQLGIPRGTISAILTNRSWKHVVV